MFRKAQVKAVCFVLVCGVLAGCGVRGSLEYPKAGTSETTAATADSGQGKPEGGASKPHQSFILDKLIQ